jgi:sulfite reductase (NADPH) hemoprotein beta-component
MPALGGSAMPQMIIANRLKDGIVVFLAAGERWVPKIADGLVIEGESERERLFAMAKAHEAQSLVVDPNLIEVVVGPNGPRPKAIRESIRAFGPTI